MLYFLTSCYNPYAESGVLEIYLLPQIQVNLSVASRQLYKCEARFPTTSHPQQSHISRPPRVLSPIYADSSVSHSGSGSRCSSKHACTTHFVTARCTCSFQLQVDRKHPAVSGPHARAVTVLRDVIFQTLFSVREPCGLAAVCE